MVKMGAWIALLLIALFITGTSSQCDGSNPAATMCRVSAARGSVVSLDVTSAAGGHYSSCTCHVDSNSSGLVLQFHSVPMSPQCGTQLAVSFVDGNIARSCVEPGPVETTNGSVAMVTYRLNGTATNPNSSYCLTFSANETTAEVVISCNAPPVVPAAVTTAPSPTTQAMITSTSVTTEQWTAPPPKPTVSVTTPEMTSIIQTTLSSHIPTDSSITTSTIPVTTTIQQPDNITTPHISMSTVPSNTTAAPPLGNTTAVVNVTSTPSYPTTANNHTADNGMTTSNVSATAGPNVATTTVTATFTFADNTTVAHVINTTDVTSNVTTSSPIDTTGNVTTSSPTDTTSNVTTSSPTEIFTSNVTTPSPTDISTSNVTTPSPTDTTRSSPIHTTSNVTTSSPTDTTSNVTTDISNTTTVASVNTTGTTETTPSSNATGTTDTNITVTMETTRKTTRKPWVPPLQPEEESSISVAVIIVPILVIVLIFFVSICTWIMCKRARKAAKQTRPPEEEDSNKKPDVGDLYKKGDGFITANYYSNGSKPEDSDKAQLELSNEQVGNNNNGEKRSDSGKDSSTPEKPLLQKDRGKEDEFSPVVMEADSNNLELTAIVIESDPNDDNRYFKKAEPVDWYRIIMKGRPSNDSDVLLDTAEQSKSNITEDNKEKLGKDKKIRKEKRYSSDEIGSSSDSSRMRRSRTGGNKSKMLTSKHRTGGSDHSLSSVEHKPTSNKSSKSLGSSLLLDDSKTDSIPDKTFQPTAHPVVQPKVIMSVPKPQADSSVPNTRVIMSRPSTVSLPSATPQIKAPISGQPGATMGNTRSSISQLPGKQQGIIPPQPSKQQGNIPPQPSKQGIVSQPPTTQQSIVCQQPTTQSQPSSSNQGIKVAGISSNPNPIDSRRQVRPNSVPPLKLNLSGTGSIGSRSDFSIS